MKPTVIAAVFIALNSLASAQQERKPEPPLPPEGPSAPEAPRPPGRQRRPPDAPGPVDEPRPPLDHLPPVIHGFESRGAPMKPTPFLGVITSPVTPVLGAQLGLPDGFGLVVEEVLPDSPAAKAGVQRHDVLKLFNDQQLIDPGQLATLIRGRGTGAEASLTILRHGQEQKLNVTIGERMMPERKPLALGNELRRTFDNVYGSVRENIRPLQDQLRQFQDRMREFQDRFREWQKNPGAGPAPQPPQLEPLPKDAFGPTGVDILRESRPGGASEVKAIVEGNTRTWKTGQARVFLKDDEGEIELSSDGGHRMLTSKNAHGEVIFSGPVDNDAQRRALPAAIRQKMEKLDARSTSDSRVQAAAGSAADTAREPSEREIQ